MFFGGKNGEQGRMNDVYIIDLHMMVCQNPKLYMYAQMCILLLLLEGAGVNLSPKLPSSPLKNS